MRDFNDSDRNKKADRIRLGENPANLPPEKLAGLEKAVKVSFQDGCLPCPAGWKIAKDNDVPRLAIGGVMDKLGLRVTGCQLGFFRVDKTPYEGTASFEPGEQLKVELSDMDKNGSLTCSAVFDMARRLGMKPADISNAANIMGLKIRQCQLGCF